jgi:hypothetical protein
MSDNPCETRLALFELMSDNPCETRIVLLKENRSFLTMSIRH